MKKILFLIFGLLLISGCAIKVEYNFKINKDKSVNIGFTSAYDNELIDMLISDDTETDQTYTDEERWAYIEESIAAEDIEAYGFDFTRYEEEEFKGLTFTKNISNIDQLVGTNEDCMNISDIGEQEEIKIFTKNNDIYYLCLDVETVDFDSLSGATFNLVISLPNEPIRHNATNVSEDGKTLTWDLVNIDDSLLLEFEIKTFSWQYIVYGMALVFIIIIIILANRKNKNKKSVVLDAQQVKNVETKKEPNIETDVTKNNKEAQIINNSNNVLSSFTLGINTNKDVDLTNEPRKPFSFDTMQNNQPTEDLTFKNNSDDSKSNSQ